MKLETEITTCYALGFHATWAMFQTVPPPPQFYLSLFMEENRDLTEYM